MGRAGSRFFASARDALATRIEEAVDRARELGDEGANQ
jgi:hypothetical protein